MIVAMAVTSAKQQSVTYRSGANSSQPPIGKIEQLRPKIGRFVGLKAGEFGATHDPNISQSTTSTRIADEGPHQATPDLPLLAPPVAQTEASAGLP